MPQTPLTWDEGGLRVVLATAPPGVAGDLAQDLVQQGLAACVNVVPGLRSVYRWQGAVTNDPESLLIAKTTADGVEALAARLRAMHPYEVPEVLVLRPTQVEAAYARWVAASVGSGGA